MQLNIISVVKARIFADGFLEPPECTCLGAVNYKFNTRCCKHVAALLWAYYAKSNFETNSETPPLFHRPNMNRFTSANPLVQEKVRANLTWPGIMKQLNHLPPEKRSWTSSKNVILVQPKQKGKRRRNRTDITLNELKLKLRSFNLKCSGNKAELIRRLEEYEEKNNKKQEEQTISKLQEENEELKQRLQQAPKYPSIVISVPTTPQVRHPAANSYRNCY